MEELYDGYVVQSNDEIEQMSKVEVTRHQRFFCNHCSLYHNQLEDLEYISRCNVCGRELELE